MMNDTYAVTNQSTCESMAFSAAAGFDINSTTNRIGLRPNRMGATLSFIEHGTDKIVLCQNLELGLCVIPAQAEIQIGKRDPRLRGNDETQVQRLTKHWAFLPLMCRSTPRHQQI
jgi:hypothetical protein